MKTTHWVLVYSICIMALALGIYGTRILRYEVGKVEGMEQGDPWDFIDVLYYLPICGFARWLFDYLFAEKIINRLRMVDRLNYERKKSKSTKEGYNIIRYSIMVIVALYLFYDTILLPKMCLGKFECGEFARYIMTIKPDAKLRFYFSIQFSFHGVTLIEFLYKNWMERVPEFHELFLHHCLAQILCIFCYSTSVFQFGIALLFVSDLSDTFMTSVRFLRDMKFQVPLISISTFETIIFCIMLFFWTYSRVGVAAYCLFKGAVVGLYHGLNGDAAWFASPNLNQLLHLAPYFLSILVLLLPLICLNLYWTFMVLEIAYHRIFSEEQNFAIRRWGEKEKLKGQTADSDKKKTT